ncbi:hypothetical protein IW140_002996 [Coemansia sp. RSA 1813]|nr:hypothetical protein LPJ74_005796 [Coemansia sp. RSA 1843]KAJ2091423.1 hypothetical protein IW138_001882 [Coemansia sp. RSA 986]KAJ2210556.1 hypothetical protein EV179_006160 [Coemansia sp. RSA 487]KAJ2569588.1 hypothetical protein IW140_002996 [Coemansia sp. RSA 1813]
MQHKLHQASRPIIDTDPIFSRVVRYFRWSDYAKGVGWVAYGPAFMYFFEKFQPSGTGKKPLIRSMKVATGIGFVQAFLMMYAKSCARFFGYAENAREIRMYREEYRKLKAEGKSMHGTSRLPLSLQRTAAEYSTGAFLNFDVIPIFNFVNHPYHGQSEGVIPEDEK